MQPQYIEDLIKLFEEFILESSLKPIDGLSSLLRTTLEAKKYDLQDVSLIEVIVRDDSKTLKESYLETIENKIQDINGEDVKKEVIDIYITSLEYLVDYYYNNLISKHFSHT